LALLAMPVIPLPGLLDFSMIVSKHSKYVRHVVNRFVGLFQKRASQLDGPHGIFAFLLTTVLPLL
jgi:hypothetical protein